MLLPEYHCFLFGSTRWQMFFKKGVIKSYAIFTGKQKCFPLNIMQFLSRAFFHRRPLVAISALYQYLSKLLLRRLLVILFTLTRPSQRLKGLRQFLIIESPLKIMKNAFYFTLKALFVLKIFKFLS